jgi:cytochrome c oxidase subunit II
MGRAMQFFSRLSAALAAILLAPVALSSAALAQAPRNWSIGMGTPFSPVKERIISLHNLVLVIITLVTIFVAVLLLLVMVKFNEKKNPNPSQVSHHTGLEVAWTVIPVLILVIIAIPSFRLIYFQDRTADPELTIKATGHQWYWEYTYPDKGDLNFTSYGLSDEDVAKQEGKLRMLSVDNELVVPVGKNIRVLTNSSDVIHSWFIPSLGVQRYAIPGRTIETWFRADKPGLFYGECNQVCGTNHSRMPIAVRAVPEEEFNAWLVTAKTKFSEAAPAVPAHRAEAASKLLTVAEVRR